MVTPDNIQSTEKLWADLRTQLGHTNDSTDPEADVAAVVGLFDVLSTAESRAIAGFMLDELRPSLRDGLPLMPVQRAVLGVVDPYLRQSDLASEARSLVAQAFSEQATRTFGDRLALAYGLIDLNYRPPGSDEDWERFYEAYADSAEHRFDAFDVALAGVADWSIGTFQRLASCMPVESWLVDRLDAFLPTLHRNFSSAQVTSLLQSIFDRCDDNTERLRLAGLAEGYNIVILSTKSAGSKNNPNNVHLLQSNIPAELTDAFATVQAEKKARRLPESMKSKKIKVFNSGYTGAESIDQFQQAVIGEICGLVTEDWEVLAPPTHDFAELASAINARRKVVFAFPTYLTNKKRDMDYSCLSFGKLRRIGALFPAGCRLANATDRPKNLTDLLQEVRVDQGAVYCIRNYALAEIVRQIAESDRNLEEWFDDKHIHECDMKDGLPRISTSAKRNFVFLFDLAGLSALNQRKKEISRSRHRGSRKSNPLDWMRGAQIDVLTHSAEIDVGLLFSKYVIDWLLEKDRWNAIYKLVSSWSTRSNFADALEQLGIDVEPITQPPRGTLKDVSNMSRVVNG